MKPAMTNKALLPPAHWQDMAHGLWLKEQLEQTIHPWLGKLFGYYSLSIGELAAELDLSACPIRKKICLNEKGGEVKAKICQLPIHASSIDACVLPFCLDFCNDPHQLLREAHRVVIADGHLLLMGFNPYSLLVAGKLLPGCKHKAPWNGRFFSCHRVKDWLQLLGCEIVDEQHLAWNSLLSNPSDSNQAQRLGQQYVPWLSSVYVLLARKREIPLTPISLMRRKARSMKPVSVLTGAGVAG